MKSFAAVLLLAAMVCGCVKQIPDELEITIPESTLISSFGGNINITLTANNPTEISSDASWLKVSKSSWTPTDEAPKTVIILSAAENESAAVNSATVTFKAGSLTKTVSVTQTEKGRIVLEGSEMELGSEGGEVKVTLSTNLEDLSVICDQSWIQLAETKAMTGKTYTFSVKENSGIDSRTAEITFSYRTVSETVTLTQNGSFSLLTFSATGTAKAPEILPKPTHGRIDWGDGDTGAYYAGKEHSFYMTDTPYEVSIKVSPANTATFSSIVGLNAIDFSEF